MYNLGASLMDSGEWWDLTQKEYLSRGVRCGLSGAAYARRADYEELVLGDAPHTRSEFLRLF